MSEAETTEGYWLDVNRAELDAIRFQAEGRLFDAITGCPRRVPMSATDYRPWDREEKLGPPPWKQADPKLIAWEKAHGHDVRSKCYSEFGCLVLPDYEAMYDRLREAAQRVCTVAAGLQRLLPIALDEPLTELADMMEQAIPPSPAAVETP